jgi:2-aminoethylphosphonate transport system permease protein
VTTFLPARAEAVTVDLRSPAPAPERSRGRWWLLPPSAVVGLFFLWPLATVVLQSVRDDEGRWVGLASWREVLSSREFHRALAHSLEIAVASTAGCVVLGTFLAVVVAFVPFPGARAVGQAATLVLAFPSFVIALSFAVLYGSTGVVSSLAHALVGVEDLTGGFIYSRWAVVLAEVTFYTPFVLRPVLAACERVPPDQLRVAASLGARPARVVRTVLLPELLPALVSGAGLCLLLTLNEFGIVLFIGAKGVLTLPVLVYTKGVVAFDYPGACVLACVQVALSLLLLGLTRSLGARWGRRRAAVD